MVEDKMYLAKANNGGRQEGNEDGQGQSAAHVAGWRVSESLLAVVNLKVEHAGKWRDANEAYWFAQLQEEMYELADALIGIHEHTPETELMQIAAICLNWLEMREERKA